MATLVRKGQPIEATAAARQISDMDAYARERWEIVALDLFESMGEYLPLRNRWTRMSDWLNAHNGHEKWRERKKQELIAYTLFLGPGGAFDRTAKVLQRMGIAYRQLSESALAVLVTDYGVPMAERDHPFWTNLFLDNEITDYLDMLDCYAIALGGHARKRPDLGDCHF